ncbi:MAG: DUF3145 family protein [Mycobacteriales bacterium]
MTGSTGCLFVYTCPSSLRAAADRAIGTIIASSAGVDWSARDGACTAIGDWTGRPGSAAALAGALRSLGAVTFDVTEDPGPGYDGERFSYAPGLGLFRAATNAVGDVVVDENQLAAAVRDSPNAEALRERLARLLGRPWDDVLEPLRMRAWVPDRAAAAG